MAENKKLEAAVDLLEDYGGFDRDYLKDKLLINSSKEKPDNKNKMAEVAALFGKKLDEIFEVFKEDCGCAYVKFTEDGLRMVHQNGKVFTRNDIEDYGFSVDLEDLITESAVIVDD